MESLQNNFSTNNNDAPSTVTNPQETDESNEILYFSINQDYK